MQKRLIYGAVFCALLIFTFWSFFGRVTDELGPIGANKDGRQIFVQTWDAKYQRDFGGAVRIETDFSDSSFLKRLLVQEPMRTTLRINYLKSAPKEQLVDIQRGLHNPYSPLLAMYSKDVSLRADLDVSKERIEQFLHEDNAQSIADFLSGWGFKKVEVYYDGKILQSVDLAPIGKGNVLVSGSPWD